MIILISNQSSFVSSFEWMDDCRMAVRMKFSHDQMWMDKPMHVGDRIARLIGAEAGHVVMGDYVFMGGLAAVLILAGGFILRYVIVMARA